jgi:trans-aconitate methyltransferase
MVLRADPAGMRLQQTRTTDDARRHRDLVSNARQLFRRVTGGPGHRTARSRTADADFRPGQHIDGEPIAQSEHRRTGAPRRLGNVVGIGHLIARTDLRHNRRMADKPFSAACERNRDPILAVLMPHFSDRRNAFEIGSGTGQHAAHFAAALPQLTWQTSDRDENLAGIALWLAEAALPNTPAPIEFDVNGVWPIARYDALFSANTLHIMSWPEVQALFKGLPNIATPDCKLAIYGPFNYDGKFTSDSNRDFDASLRQRSAHMGIRDIADVNALAKHAGFAMIDDVEMPANNRCLVWQRQADW